MNVAVALFTVPLGPLVIVVSGPVTSVIVIERLASVLTAPSLSVAVAVTWKVPGLANVCPTASGDSVPADTLCGPVPSPKFSVQAKPAAASAAEASVAVKVMLTGMSSGAEAGAVIATVGATFVTVKVNAVVAVAPAPSVAVIVTCEVAGPSAPVAIQLHVPAASSCVTVPVEAASVTVPFPSASEKVPVCVSAEPSAPVSITAGEP